MLIYYCCRLRATVTIRVVEIDGRDAMFVTGAFEMRAAVHRFGCLIFHFFHSSPYSHSRFGQWVYTLRAGNELQGFVSGRVSAWRRGSMKRTPKNIIGGYFDEGVCINFVWRHPLGGTGLLRRYVTPGE
jgi:hypothetical protein